MAVKGVDAVESYLANFDFLLFPAPLPHRMGLWETLHPLGSSVPFLENEINTTCLSGRWESGRPNPIGSSLTQIYSSFISNKVRNSQIPYLPMTDFLAGTH